MLALGDLFTSVSVSASLGKLPTGSACSDVHMALCAVNLAECAEEKIPPSTLVEIHLTAAMGLKTRCGGKLGFLAVSTLHVLPQACATHCPQPGANTVLAPKSLSPWHQVPTPQRGRHLSSPPGLDRCRLHKQDLLEACRKNWFRDTA